MGLFWSSAVAQEAPTNDRDFSTAEVLFEVLLRISRIDAVSSTPVARDAFCFAGRVLGSRQPFSDVLGLELSVALIGAANPAAVLVAAAAAVRHGCR